MTLNGMSDWHFKGSLCHPGPQQELHEVQQEGPSPAPGEVQPHTPKCAGSHLSGKQLARTGPGVLLDTGLNRSERCVLAERGSACPALGKVLPAG